jgi:hypothetical protein
MNAFCTSRTLAHTAAQLILFAAAIAHSHSAIAYNANADLVANSPNPNGVWRYGYTTSLGSVFIPHAEYFSTTDVYGWRTNLAFGAPAFTYFMSPGFGVLVGETSLHSGPNNEFSVLRFTTPVTGPYDLLATWRGPGDTGNTDLYLLKNNNGGSPLGSTTSTTISGMIQLSNVPLVAGDTIDLAVGNGGDGFFSDNTPVNLQIVPALSGDFNHNGVVDAADYPVWRKTDGNSAGYNLWRAHFGQSSGSGLGESAAAAVPEATSALLLISGAMLVFGGGRRGRTPA